MTRNDNYFRLRAADDSMEPKIRKGDILIVRKQSKCKSGDICVVFLECAYITVKKIFKNKKGIILTELNPDAVPMYYSMREIADKKIRIIGRVTETRSRL